ncbi:hypothetical protein V1511DRAFT_507571 [Dipodascopsis uninucleata]
MSVAKTYFVAGASQGIGLNIATILAQNSENVIFASARDVSKSPGLKKLVSEHKNVHTVVYDAASETSASEAAMEVLKVTDSVDVVIANAATATWVGKVSDVTADLLIDHFKINTVGPVLLFKAFSPLLERSSTKTFLAISSSAGSNTFITEVGSVYNLPYSISKAALNNFVAETAMEYKSAGFKIYAVHPGVVSTGMQKKFFDLVVDAGVPLESLKDIPVISPQESAASIIKTLGDLTVEKTGSFLNYDGTSLPW